MSQMTFTYCALFLTPFKLVESSIRYKGRGFSSVDYFFEFEPLRFDSCLPSFFSCPSIRSMVKKFCTLNQGCSRGWGGVLPRKSHPGKLKVTIALAPTRQNISPKAISSPPPLHCTFSGYRPGLTSI